MKQPVVYDKAKYHSESVQLAGLAEVQTEVHAAFFLGWLIDNNLLSAEFVAESNTILLSKYKARLVMATDVYGDWGYCLTDDMLDHTGNAFTQHYFDFDRGRYMTDYGDLLVRDLPTEFHVENTWENYEIIRERIDKRFAEWQKNGPPKRPWWRLW